MLRGGPQRENPVEGVPQRQRSSLSRTTWRAILTMADVNLYVEDGPLQDFPVEGLPRQGSGVEEGSELRGPLRATIVKFSRP